ncbi:MAG TPA: nuclear transport factor 2 family protein [Puia sp.]|nr:nuclear transport factor 2 family protein [Puia sp.]
MKKIISICLVTFFATRSFGQHSDEWFIRKVLNEQVTAWNRGSIEEFMKGYWFSDSLMFVRKDGIQFGYSQALEHYKVKYSDSSKMGRLTFRLLSIKKLSSTCFFVVGKWFLKRKIGDLDGIYTLVFRKINGQWVIIADHTS